ncbi:MAG: hypothetical protein QW331_00015 [Candidatus Woesearchaeota archaeon]
MKNIEGIETKVERSCSSSLLERALASGLTTGVALVLAGGFYGAAIYHKEWLGKDSTLRTQAISYTVTIAGYGFSAGFLIGAGLTFFDAATAGFDRRDKRRNQEEE